MATSPVSSTIPPPTSPSPPATSSAPPPQSPPSTPPPSPSVVPPPTAAPPPPVSPPPSPPAASPPAAKSSPPPSPPASPSPAAKSSPPPSPPASPSPTATSSPPPSPPASPPPTAKSSPPPPTTTSPPPNLSPVPPTQASSPSPPPPAATSSPPPPIAVSPPSPVDSPPPPPEKSPNTPTLTPPSPPNATSSPPPSVPSSPAVTSPSTPRTNSSASGSLSPPISPLPSLPGQTPASKSTPGTSGTTTASSEGGGGMKPGTAAAVGIVVGFLALSIVVLALWFTRRRKKRSGSGYGGGYVMPSPYASSQNSDSIMRPQKSAHLVGSASGSNFLYSPDHHGMGNSKCFTYEELFNATQGFSAQKLLGEGGFGCVYKGLLVDGREVAVKQLKIGGGQGEREFRAEVEIISRVHHRHLVSLVGYCISDHQRLLVYEYVPNNTLHYHMHGEGRPVMEWSTRVKVAIGAARGIAYLHEDCHPRIIHRDIKASNILLDNNFDAKVADFGLAKLAADANTHVTTRVMGTFGYMAPEYASSGKLTEKSDVFSYGVVLLELITGRKPVDSSQPIGDESLVEWARPLLTESLESERFMDELIDPRLNNAYVGIEMFRMIEAAAVCIRHSAPKRPRMSQVVRAFESMAEYADLTNGLKLGQSEVFDSREQSAQIRMFQRMAFGSQDFSYDYSDRSHSSWQS